MQKETKLKIKTVMVFVDSAEIEESVIGKGKKHLKEGVERMNKTEL